MFVIAMRCAAPPLIALLVIVNIAHAQDTTIVTISWGQIVQDWASAILSIALAGLAAAWAWLGRSIPSQVFAILVSLRAEQFLQKAIEYGINAVAEASKDKRLEVNVGNAVLAKALQYIVDNAPGWLIAWMGGKEVIAEKIWARLDLAPGASDAGVKAAASMVNG